MSFVSASSPLPLPRWQYWGWLLASAIGFIDAAYLTAKYYQGELPTCGLSSGCETVLTSQFATFAGAPIALAGALYYLAAFLLVFMYGDFRRPILLHAAVLLVAGGWIVSLLLLYVQLFVLEAVCQYCLASALTSTVLFVLACFIFQQRERSPQTGFIAKRGSPQRG